MVETRGINVHADARDVADRKGRRQREKKMPLRVVGGAATAPFPRRERGFEYKDEIYGPRKVRREKCLQASRGLGDVDMGSSNCHRGRLRGRHSSLMSPASSRGKAPATTAGKVPGRGT